MLKKLYLLVIILAIIAVGLEITNIYLSDKVASNSVVVRKLQTSIVRLNEENQIIKSDLLTQTSFEMLSSKAVGLGFNESKNYISLHKVQLSYSQ